MLPWLRMKISSTDGPQLATAPLLVDVASPLQTAMTQKKQIN